MGRAGCMVLAAALVVWAPALVVVAQDDEDEAESESDTESEDEAESESDTESEDESETETESEPEAEAEADTESGAADEGPRQWYFGLYLRYAFLPSFWLGPFLDEAPTVANFAPGGVAVNFWNGVDSGASFQLGLGYTSYAFEDAFRVSGDPVEDTEWVKSDLGMIHLTGSVLWNLPILSNLVFEYGLGLDFGIVTGSLVRTEARFVDASGEWVPCTSKDDPADPLGRYCEEPTRFGFPSDGPDDKGAHYHVVDESAPPVFAMPILPHLALRYEPINGLALKFETALIPVMWFGLSAAYAPF